jgi:hypothetical protein
MQFSDQPPEEVQRQASQPLYEFAADDPAMLVPPAMEDQAGVEGDLQQVHAVASGAARAESQRQPTEEEFRLGLVYPPPPSFYQNLQTPLEPPPLPAAPPVEGYVPPAQPGVPVPPAQAWSGAQPPPVKKSRKWIWIVVAIFSAAILLSCGLCGWATYNIFSSTFQEVSGSMTVVDDYYTALQAKNYAAAYGYLDPQGTISGLTLAKFTQQAQDLDAQYGPVRSYVPGQPSFSTDSQNGPNLSQFTITVTITRPKLNYTALLTLDREGGKWKIVDFDRI